MLRVYLVCSSFSAWHRCGSTFKTSLPSIVSFVGVFSWQDQPRTNQSADQAGKQPWFVNL